MDLERDGRHELEVKSQIARLRQFLAQRGATSGDGQSAASVRDLHRQIATCARHGSYRPYVLDEHGELRATGGCPACRSQPRHALDDDVPPVLAGAALDGFVCATVRQRTVQAKVLQRAGAFAAGEGGGLVLWGETGTGKSHLAVGLLRHCQAAGRSARYIRAVDLMNRLRQASGFSASAEDRQLIDRLADVGVLVVDDVGKSSGTDFERAAMFNLLDRRWGERRPTVITSNETAESLRDLLTPAGFDRVTEAGANVLHLQWGSYRRNRVA
jgi:DNA replication protein DnaC